MNDTTKKFIQIGAFMMALSVGLGAFGAHGLKQTLEPAMMAVYNTAVEYQFYHALGLFVVAFVAHLKASKKVALSGYFMIAGTVIFSGSLYIMTVTGMKWVGIITPIGGTGFIIAWLILAASLNDNEI